MQNANSIKLAKLLTGIIFSMLAIDLFLFGGGRVVEFGGVTFRMLIFAFCLLLSLTLILIAGKMSKVMLTYSGAAMLLLIISSYISLLKGEFTFASLSPYLFFLLAITFSIYPIYLEKIFRRLLPPCSVFMSIVYILFIVMLLLGRVSILDVYKFIPESEVFLRGAEGLVYKGFVFIMIGALYFIICKNKSFINLAFTFICITAIIFTLTRGFVLSLLVAILLYYFNNKRTHVSIKFVMLCIGIAIPIYLLAVQPAFLFRAGSDSTRINDMLIFLDYLDQNPQNFIFGSGISGFLGERPSVENVYMDVILHFGLLGLAMLLAIYVKIHLDYKYIAKNIAPSYRKRIDWLYYSIFLLYLQSTFNPYINNYIGGVFVVMVLFYFNATRIFLAKLKTKAKSESELFELA